MKRVLILIAGVVLLGGILVSSDAQVPFEESCIKDQYFPICLDVWGNGGSGCICDMWIDGGNTLYPNSTYADNINVSVLNASYAGIGDVYVGDDLSVVDDTFIGGSLVAGTNGKQNHLFYVWGPYMFWQITLFDTGGLSPVRYPELYPFAFDSFGTPSYSGNIRNGLNIRGVNTAPIFGFMTSGGNIFGTLYGNYGQDSLDINSFTGGLRIINNGMSIDADNKKLCLGASECSDSYMQFNNVDLQVWSAGKVEVLSNMSISGSLAMGNQAQPNASCVGCINASIVFADIFEGNSPLVMCETPWCMVSIPSSGKTYYFEHDKYWNVTDLRDSDFNPIGFNDIPLAIRQKAKAKLDSLKATVILNKLTYECEIQPFHHFTDGECIHNEQEECESVSWHAWIGSACYDIPGLACGRSPEYINYTWNSSAGECQYSDESECRNRSGFWTWTGSSCNWDYIEECNLNKLTYWNGEECVPYWIVEK